MNSNIKIFISTHRPDVYFPNINLFYPIQVGTAQNNCFPNILHDNEGDNISSKNPSYCELTAQYYVYKNVDADYYGFFHYRRYFNFSETMYPEVIKPFIYGDVIAQNNSDSLLKSFFIDEKHIEEIVKKYDYIAPTMITSSDGLTVYEQYRGSVEHYISDLDTVLDIIKADYPEIWPYAMEYCNGYNSYLCNMFIMKKELFLEYSSFLFDVLKKHEDICDMSNYSPVAKRVSGYLGERLCGIYLTYLKAKKLKGKELQRVFFQEFRTEEAIEAEKKNTTTTTTSTPKKTIPYMKAQSSYFDENYEKWFKKRKASTEVLNQQKNINFKLQPKYSIIVPLYNTPLEFFDDMLNSVLNQSYSNYELILINASPNNIELSEHVVNKTNDNSAIKLITLYKNYGITENTNYGIKEASGDFLCFFDHDDTLEPDVLYEYTKALNDNPDIDMFYCDEDKIQGSQYCNPFFKPDWNIDYLNAVNYVCHFLTVRKSILDNMDLPTSEYDGSQDYHMTYRIGEKARAICHIPKVLYHWRIHSHSTASSASQKNYTLDSSILSVQKHLDRTGIKAKVIESDICPRRFTIKYDMPDEKTSIIIDYDSNIDKLNRCILSLRREVTTTNYEIIIVGQKDDLKAISFYLKRMKKLGLNIITQEVLNTDNNCPYNIGSKVSTGDYLLFVDSNIEFIKGTFEQLIGTCTRDDVIAAGPRFLLNNTDIDNVGISLSNKGIIKNALGLNKIDGASLDRFLCSMDVEAISGNCLAIRKDIFDKFDGFDARFTNLFKGVELSIRCSETLPDHNIVVDPIVEVKTKKSNDSQITENNSLLVSKWSHIKDIKQSSYNPNLDMYKTYDVINYNSTEIIKYKIKRKGKNYLKKIYHATVE